MQPASRPALGVPSPLLAAILFFVSGALGLGYELVWIRKAALVVGTSHLALTTVVSSFFLGIALGSQVVGRYLRSTRWSPLFVYGLFEGAIGLFALAFPVLFRIMETVYGVAYPLTQESPTLVFALRFALLFVLFLIPTFFMGGTLPLLLDGLVTRDRSIGSLTSFLYGLNILGAVAGVLVTAYFAIPALGKNGTSLAAGAGNLAIGLVAVVAFRRDRPVHVEAIRPASPSLFIATASFASGAAAIGYQVFWARYFALFNTGSVYLTALLLAVYLAALAVGSMALAWVLRAVSPLRVLSFTQPLVPLLTMLSLNAWVFAEHRFDPLPPASSYATVANWGFWSETADTIFFAPLAQVALVVFVPVLLIATGLPSLIVAASGSHNELRSAAGRTVFWNTLGGSVGAATTGYLLIPAFGLGGALMCLGVVSVAIGLAAALRLRDASWAAPARALSVASVLGVLALAATLGVGRADLAQRTIESFGWGAKIGGDRLVELTEGPVTTAFVFDALDHRSIGSGNVCLAVVYKDRISTQAVQGHLPALFFPGNAAPRRGLGIALGSGQSFGALLLHPVEHLDLVDISPEMVDLSLRHFAEYNHGLAEDPRVNIHVDDGRHFVERAADSSYDVVSMEPPPPTAEGVFALYSLEFYQQVRRVLREGGVFMQWLPLYRVTPRDLHGIVRTQAEVFPYSFVIRAGPIDFMVLSFDTATPPVFDTAEIAARAQLFENERQVANTRWEPGCHYDVASLEGVLALVVSGPEDVRAMDGPLYLDDYEQLAYTSGDRIVLSRYGTWKAARLAFAELRLTPFAELQRYFRQPIPADELDDERARALAFYSVPIPSELRERERAYRESTSRSDRFRAALEVARQRDASLDREGALQWLGRAMRAQPRQLEDAHIQTVREIAQRAIAIHQATLRDWLDARPERERRSTLGLVISQELDAYASRRQTTRPDYVADWL